MHTGQFTSQAVASADGGLRSVAKTQTKVVAPKLVVDVTGAKNVFLGRNVTYLLKVTNTGDGIADNIVLSSNVPSNVRIDSIAKGGASNR